MAKNTKLKFLDESGDRKYFTQIPNYIANHSTAVDQALYFQMKRYAGEDGKCFATQETLMKKLGIGKWAYRKSLKYLLEKNWIRFVGMTGGKTRPIKTYAMVDIWKINIMEYEEIPARMAVSLEKEIPASLDKDTGQNGSKIPASLATEEEPVKEEPIKKTLTKVKEGNTFGNSEVNSFIETLKSEFELNLLDGSAAENRKYAWLAIKKCGGLDIAKKVIMAAAADDFYGDKIASVKKLYYHMAEIVQKAKGKQVKVAEIK